MTNQLVRLTRGHLRGCTGRITELTADDVRIRLTATVRTIRVPRDGGWYEPVDETPMSAREAREKLAAGAG